MLSSHFNIKESPTQVSILPFAFLHFFQKLWLYLLSVEHSLGRNITFLPVDVWIFLVPVHLLSFTAKKCISYFFISAVIFVSFPASNIAFTFQKPILVFNLELETSLFVPVASLRLSPLPVIKISKDDSWSLLQTFVKSSFVAVSVTSFFPKTRLIVCTKPQTWKGRNYIKFGFYLLSWPAWVTLPGAELQSVQLLGFSSHTSHPFTTR